MFEWGMLAAVLVAGSVPQDARAPDPVTELAPVTVDGRTLSEQARTFVEVVGRAPGGRMLARWNSPVCIGVVNLEAAYAQAILDRIGLIAEAVGAESEAPGCSPDVTVIFGDTATVTRLVDQAVADQPGYFRPTDLGTNLDRTALTRFVESEAPVRWWHVSLPVMADTGVPAIQLPGDEEPPTVVVSSFSRVRSTTRDDLIHAVIVVDLQKVDGYPLGALADYVAMLALAQIQPDVDIGGADSILGLFDAPPGSIRGMSPTDVAYLVGLYETPQNAVSNWSQERQIANGMVDTLRSAEPCAGRDCEPSATGETAPPTN